MENISTTNDFTTVTEIIGEEVAFEQVQRLCNRYVWASQYCGNKDVVEIACGSGQGLGYLSKHSRSIVGGDISDPLLNIARNHYGSRIELIKLDAQNLPFEDNSKDVLILFEAIYYLPLPDRFIDECRRVLRPKGKLLISTANKDLYDFNPSPFSHQYFGVRELRILLEKYGFQCNFFGDTPLGKVSARQKLMRPIKKIATQFHLIPGSMKHKRMLKKLFFGGLVIMPAEIEQETAPFISPDPIPSNEKNTTHKVILLEATKHLN